MTAAVWVRWLLRADYQISPGDLEWFAGGVSPVPIPSNRKVHVLQGAQVEVERMLLTGDLDVLLSVIPPKSLCKTEPCGGCGRTRERPNEHRQKSTRFFQSCTPW